MKTNKYPRIVAQPSPQRGNKRCALCGHQAGRVCRIDIQWSWFRGEDEVLYAHKDCLKGLTAEQISDKAAELKAELNRQTPAYKARQEEIRRHKEAYQRKLDESEG